MSTTFKHNIHEVNKKILKKYTKPRSDNDIIGPYNKYRDEYLRIYNAKKQKFLRVAKNYNDHNQKLLSSCSKSDDYDVTEEFRNELELTREDEIDYTPEFCKNCSAVLIRKRIEKPINFNAIYKRQFCTLEPWLKRYLILSKFIRIARNLIIKNRLIKVLAILKTLKDENVKRYEIEKKHDNVSYSELFERFI